MDDAFACIFSNQKAYSLFAMESTTVLKMLHTHKKQVYGYNKLIAPMEQTFSQRYWGLKYTHGTKIQAEKKMKRTSNMKPAAQTTKLCSDKHCV